MPRMSEQLQDLERQEAGVWRSWRGMRFLVARWGNKRYQARMREQRAPFLDQTGIDLSTPEQVQRFVRVAVSETILLGWEEVLNDAGEPEPYSSAQALRWIEDPRLEDFYSWVISASSEHLPYLLQRKAADLGN